MPMMPSTANRLAFGASADRQPNRHKEIEIMRNRKASCFVVTLLLILAGAGTPHGLAQDSRPCFTLASLKGAYSMIGTYGANVAIALAKRYVDREGNLTGAFLVNEPTPGSTTGARSIITGSQTGTISVNCDGTGVITRVLTVGGVQTTQMDDFAITEATISDGELIATKVVDAQRTPSAIVAGGIFLTRTWTRVP
jgi:hypothetical protein